MPKESKRFFRGSAEGHDRTVVLVDENVETRLNPKPSQELRNHSPDGFNWGYSGSGPAQLALAILLEVTQDTEIAFYLYQDFKFQFIATIRDQTATWEIREAEIIAWVRKQRGQNAI